MSQDPTDVIKLTIFEVTVKQGTSVDEANLISCYFQTPSSSSEIYQFFGRHDDHIPTIPEFLSVGTPGFQFIRAGMLWTVSEFDIDPVNLTVKGRWANPRHPADDDDGHFQAQSGPSGVSAATA